MEFVDTLEGELRLKRKISEILEKSPEIEEKIRISYSPYRADRLSVAMDFDFSVNSYNENGTPKSAYMQTTLQVGRPFFEFNNEQQEAVIMHELGHYKRKKRIKSWNRLERELGPTGWKAQLFGKAERKHPKERLEKWYILHELDADNEPIRQDLGLPFLEVLKIKNDNLPKFPKKELEELSKKELKIRIANLKEKLGIENE